jgi:hypothetical protein
MRTIYLLCASLVTCVLFISAEAQTPVVINDPTVEADKVALTTAQQSLFENAILPAARKKLASDICEEAVEIAGPVTGAFTKAGSTQTLIAYQFCETGNGIGSIGIAVIEGGRVVANLVSVESGSSITAKALPDINENGLEEIAIYYSGGMHQGAGGTGVDIFEFTPSGALKGIGWFQAEEYTETGPLIGYRVTVKPGKAPLFSRERFTHTENEKWRRSRKVVPLRLSKSISEFEVVR